MVADFTFFVGTVGRGLSISRDGGKTFRRPDPLTADTRVYEVTSDPTNSDVVWAGTDTGIFKSDDKGQTFKHMGLDGQWIWRIAVDPVDPDTVFAGIKTLTRDHPGPWIYRSRDGGRSWDATSCNFDPVFPAPREQQLTELNRLTGLAVDPTNHNNIWACVEADGVRRSLDGGDTWTNLNANLPGVHVPDPIVAAMDDANDRRRKSAEISSDLARELSAMCRGVHVMAIGWESEVPGILDAAGLSRG